MKYFYFALFFCFSTLTVQAQFNYEKGFIVTNSLDTIYGEMKYGTLGERATRVTFIEDSTDHKIKYRPFTIKGYSVRGQYYESRIFDIHPALSYGLGVFMRRLNVGEGPVKIYEYWNTDYDFGFSQTFLVKGKQTSFEINFLKFKKQVASFVKDHPDLQKRVLDGEFKRKELGLIIEEYNRFLKNK